MKKLVMGLVLVLGVLATGSKAEAYTYYFAGSGVADVTDVTYEVTYDYTEAYKLANKINEERAKLGHKQFIIAEPMMRSAMKNAAALNWDFSHEPAAVDYLYYQDGRYATGYDIITTVGTAEDAYSSYYNSPGHRVQMLDWFNSSVKTYYMGVGIVNGYTCVLFSSGNKSDQWEVGNTLTNYTELYTLHVNNAVMTPEKWGTISIDGWSIDLEVGALEDRSVIGMGYGENTWGQRWLSYHAFDFSVSDPNVIKVENGMVTAVGEGTATLTIKLKNTNVVGTVTYNVTDPEKKVSKPVKLKKVSKFKVQKYKVKGHKTMLDISWKRIKGVDDYTVQVAKDKKFKKLLVNKKVKESDTTYACLGITKKFKGKKVYVRVRAVNGKKTGPWSKVKTIKTYK